MNEETLSVKSKKVANRKEAKQISFRVSDEEYLKLKLSADALNMSVPSFVKKKAQGVRLVQPKVNLESAKLIAKELDKFSIHLSKVERFGEWHEKNGTLYNEEVLNGLNSNMEYLRKELHKLWERLS